MLTFVCLSLKNCHSIVIECSDLSVVSSDSFHEIKGLLLKLEGMGSQREMPQSHIWTCSGGLVQLAGKGMPVCLEGA